MSQSILCLIIVLITALYAIELSESNTENEHSEERLEAPTEFSLLQIINGNSAIVSWIEVSPESVRGNFRGYKIQTWAEGDESNIKEIIIKPNSSRAYITKFTPNSKNFARILAFNNHFNGPTSDTISFDTPEGVPEVVELLEVYQMGTSALWLKWKKPLKTNGDLKGYRIYYETVDRKKLGPLQEKEQRIEDPNQSTAKLAGLKADTKYRIHVVGYTKMGEGDDFYVEQSTKSLNAEFTYPDKPSLKLELQSSANSFARVKVIWIPNIAKNNPGTHFYVHYRKMGWPSFQSTDEIIFENFVIIYALDCDETYEFRVVSVNGQYETPSDVKIIETSNCGEINYEN